MWKRGAPFLLVSSLVLFAPSLADAQDDQDDGEEEADEGIDGEGAAGASDGAGEGQHGDVLFDVHATLGYYAEVGVGVRADLPVLWEGILDGVDDAVFVTLGAEVLYVYWSNYEGFAVYPLLGFQWSFFIDEEWSLFPELGVALLFGSNRDQWIDSFIVPYAGFGVRYHLSTRNALFVRGTWPTGVQLGLTF